MARNQARYSAIQALERILQSDSEPSDLDNSDHEDDNDYIPGSDHNSEIEDHVSGSDLEGSDVDAKDQVE